MKKTTQERDPQAAAKLRELMEDIGVAMITTATPDGVLRSRPMITQEITEDGELWFFTSDESGKAEDIAAEHAVSVSYADARSDRYVSVSGSATIVHDSEKVQEMWNTGLTRFFPKGLDDPHLALLRVRIETAEYWDATSGAMRPISEKKKPGADAEGENGGEHTQVDIRATPASG